MSMSCTEGNTRIYGDVGVPARSWGIDREQRNHISRCLFVWGKQPITRSVLGRILGSMHGNTTPQRLSGCIGIGMGGTQPWSTQMTRGVPKERTYNGGVREQKRGDRGSSRLRVHDLKGWGKLGEPFEPRVNILQHNVIILWTLPRPHELGGFV